MPVSIAELASGRRTFSLDTPAGAVRITYRPYEMTPAREAELSRLGDNTVEEYADEGENTANTEAGLARLIEQFMVIVEAWDLIGPLSNRASGEVIVAEGETIPVKADTLRHCSSFFLVQVLNGVSADARPKGKQRTS